MTRDEMLSDLAYARTLAEEGRSAPLLGGAHLSFWGVLVAIAFTGQWAILEGRLPYFGGAAFASLWMSFGVAAAIGAVLLRQRIGSKPGLTTIGARTEHAVWSAAGFAIFAVVVGSLARMVMTQDPTAPNAIPGAAFALYGAALFATAEISGHVWLKRFAWLSFSAALTLCLFANENWAYLVGAAASLLVLLVPGIILLRREPAATA